MGNFREIKKIKNIDVNNIIILNNLNLGDKNRINIAERFKKKNAVLSPDKKIIISDETNIAIKHEKIKLFFLEPYNNIKKPNKIGNSRAK